MCDKFLSKFSKDNLPCVAVVGVEFHMLLITSKSDKSNNKCVYANFSAGIVADIKVLVEK